MSGFASAGEHRLLEELLDATPQEVTLAAELLAVPHVLDDGLAVDLVRQFGRINGTTVKAVAGVKVLPFVAPHGGHGWRLGSPARELLVARLDRKPELLRSVHAELSQRFAEGLVGRRADEPLTREMEWRSLYHGVPVSPAQSVDALESFVERAAAVSRRSDLRAAVDLTCAHEQWLQDHLAEIAYIQGRYAYAVSDFPLAEECFTRVWAEHPRPARRVIAGHLLGVIWADRRREPWWTKAEALLVDVVDLARSTNDELGEALTLTTLGSLMTRIGGHDRLKQAERALRRSVQLRGGMVGDDDGLALSALGAVLLRQGSPEQLLEAERLFRRSLSLLPQEQQSVARDRLALVLARLGGPGRLREAETLLRERADEVTRDLDRAVVLNTLAQVLLKRGDPDALKEANDLVIQSIELGRASRNPRHVAIALLTASKIAEQRGELDLAVRRHEELIRTNRSLGLSREVQAGEDYLHDLKRRRDSQAP